MLAVEEIGSGEVHTGSGEWVDRSSGSGEAVARGEKNRSGEFGLYANETQVMTWRVACVKIRALEPTATKSFGMR